ncbi:hypothetical protein ACSBR2_036000 [Camellia fascicularis]
MLLSYIPESWETLVATVSNSTPDGVVTMSQVTSSLFNEETRRKSAGSSHSEAFVVRGRSKIRGRSKTPHGRDQSHDKLRNGSFSNKDIECHYWHEKGHMKRECRKLKNKEKKHNKSMDKKQEDTTAVTTDDLMVVCEDDCINFVGQESNWVIDSDASFHMTSRVDFFTTYTKGDYGCVQMGNEGLSKIIGMGDVCLKTNLGCKLLLKDVRLVPDIPLHLISIGKLADEDYNNKFGDRIWKLTKGSLVVVKCKKTHTLYLMQGKICKGIVNALKDDISTKLWHKQLGHMSEKELQVLFKKELLPDLKGTGVVDCSAGIIVWVRRQNGSWWPGKILGPKELLATHLMSLRSGTPIKLLGREDANM